MSADVDALADGFQAAFSGRDRPAFAEVCAEDLHYEDPLCPQPLESAAALADHVSRLWAAFPDARMEATGSRLHDGRFVALPVKLLATHRGELPELPPTGKFIVVHAIFYCELDEAREKLWRVRAFFDLYEAAVQLGVLPKAGSAGERALLMLRGFGLRR
ncbi:MAG: ester cyclase [Solirubrobacteraceae bacterium]|nr:ester cyclase [Solirubrobacteraceae bacterium]